MPRSLTVSRNYLETVKNALPRNGFPRQEDFAAHLRLSSDTVRKFLNGYSISCENFLEICHHLSLEATKIAEELNLPDDSPPGPPGPVVVLTKYEIEREPQESDCLKEILQPGSFLRIKGPQQMGKTRLLNRVLAKCQQKQDNCQIIIINWQNDFDSEAFDSYETFLKTFCAAISKYLGLPDDILDKYWNNRGSTNNKATSYFADYLLSKIENWLILVLQEMDLVFNYDQLSLDFCGLLRGWHQKYSQHECWRKLSLVIVHSTDKYASLDIATSPLANAGVTVVVEEFTRSEVDNLIEKYGLFSSSKLEELITLVKSHPFLLNHAFKKIAKETTSLEEILAKAATQESLYRDHLLELGNILEKNPDLKENFKKIVTASEPVRLNPTIAFQLESLGLVRINSDFAEPRCPLYRQYFFKYL
jgi:hypothetical protein